MTHDVDFVLFCSVFFHQFSTRPTLYIGEHAGGLYALPSLIEEGSPLVEVNIQLFLANNHNIHWFLGCFHSHTLMVLLQELKIISLFRKDLMIGPIMSSFQSDKKEMLSAKMLTLSSVKYYVNLQLQNNL